MSKSSLAHLQEVYLYDEERKRFTVRVLVRRYEDLFNRLDPTPLYQRDLAPDLLDFLRVCSDEIPERYGVDLLIQVSEQDRDAPMEAHTLEGLRHYFAYEQRVLQLQERRARGRALRYVLVSFLSISAAMLLRIPPGNVLFNFLREGLTIGGWVFLWEAISVSFIQSAERIGAQRFCHRMQAAQVTFRYSLAGLD
ncbi:MAG: hypothetical protein KA988_02150 [Longilinea sp.]|nr:hypothetical protein [Longilinea sp.]